MSTLKHHGLSETIDKIGKKSDGIIFQKYIWQLQGKIVFRLAVRSRTYVTKDANLKDEEQEFRFFTKTKNGSITMWGMGENEELAEFFDLWKYYENLEEAENEIGIPMEYKGERDWDIDGWINRQL